MPHDSTPLPTTDFSSDHARVGVREVHSVDQIRLYDQALKDLIRSFTHQRVNRNKPINVVMSTPERAFAEIRTVLKLPEKTPLKSIPLPFASIFRGDPDWDFERYNNAWLRKLNYVPTADTQNGVAKSEIFQAPWPLPYNIPYQVDIWIRKHTTYNLIEQWLMMQFGPSKELFLDIDFTCVHPTWFTKLIPYRLDSFVDNSTLEQDEQHDRDLRFTMNVTAWAWMFLPVRVVKTVHCVQLEVYEGTFVEPGPLVDTWTFNLVA